MAKYYIGSLAMSEENEYLRGRLADVKKTAKEIKLFLLTHWDGSQEDMDLVFAKLNNL